MNYNKIYDNIINRAKQQDRNKKQSYFESHHIIPKSLGGNNKKCNKVLLTAKEHFVCHCLLVKIHKNDNEKYKKMLLALYMMKTEHSYHERYINSKLYEIFKLKLYGDNGILKHENHYWFGRKHTEETKNKLSEIRQKKCNEPEEKLRLKNLAINRTPEHSEKIRRANTGKIRTEATKKKLSELHKNSQMNELNGNSKPCRIHGKTYPSVREAFRQIGGNLNTIYYRINSKQFPHYQWA